jgi:hypothetical protein
MSEIKKHWFKHDFYTCNDHKMQKLDFKYPIVGYGIFFKVVEMLYQNDGKIEYDLEFITHSLNYKKEKVLSVLSDFDLFEVQDGFLSNKRVLRLLRR